jgi:hypothetical protein
MEKILYEARHHAASLGLDAIAGTIGDAQSWINELRDILLRNGFVPCDNPSCNCGSWHARYGLPERMAELKKILADAGHPLTNENGNLISRALQELVAERDRLMSRVGGRKK